jgi:hypothetical protein
MPCAPEGVKGPNEDIKNVGNTGASEVRVLKFL